MEKITRCPAYEYKQADFGKCRLLQNRFCYSGKLYYDPSLKKYMCGVVGLKLAAIEHKLERMLRAEDEKKITVIKAGGYFSPKRGNPISL